MRFPGEMKQKTPLFPEGFELSYGVGSITEAYQECFPQFVHYWLGRYWLGRQRLRTTLLHQQGLVRWVIPRYHSQPSRLPSRALRSL